MRRIASLFLFLSLQNAYSQLELPSYYHQDESLNKALFKILEDLSLEGRYDAAEDGMEPLSIAVIDLNGEQPKIGGVALENFIYPASVYKMYVAMEVLHQIENGRYTLEDSYVVKKPNDVDTSKEIISDPRPLLRNGDTVTIGYLLDLMISRSDNSAANCLIDIADRKQINHTMVALGWKGSEVTRKFLSKQFEDPLYKNNRGTETCALHAADFMYKIQRNQLLSPWVSMQLKRLLGAQLDNSKIASALPKNTMFYHKTGWWSMYTHDVGIVDTGRIKYIIALFVPLGQEKAIPKIKQITKRVHQLIVQRNP